MTVAVIDGPAVWRGPDISGSDRWIRHFDPAEIDEIATAFELFRRAAIPLKEMRAEDFPLPRLSEEFRLMREELENGPGFRLYRGFPVDRYSVDELRAIYWGLCRHVGTAISQSHRGDVIGDVRDIGTDIRSPRGRGYTSSAKLSFHSDSTDVTGLLCVNVAKSGGRSYLVSSQAVHNEVVRRRPDLAEILYAPFEWSRQGQELPGEPPHYPQPLYGVCDGRFVSRYIRTHIESAQRFDDAPRLTEKQIEALDFVDSLTADPAFHFSFDLAPGDIEFINNHVIYHSRSAFEDWPEPERKRHLLRIWMSVANSRRLPESFSGIFRDQSPGAVRGGFPGHVAEPMFSTLPAG